jgi:hypothetical protein
MPYLVDMLPLISFTIGIAPGRARRIDNLAFQIGDSFAATPRIRNEGEFSRHHGVHHQYVTRILPGVLNLAVAPKLPLFLVLIRKLVTLGVTPRRERLGAAERFVSLARSPPFAFQDGPEHKNPVEFFRRTYLTESLKGMLVGAVQRLSGQGGDPVVQLQTNFGGGKTHSTVSRYMNQTNVLAANLEARFEEDVFAAS